MWPWAMTILEIILKGLICLEPIQSPRYVFLLNRSIKVQIMMRSYVPLFHVSLHRLSCASFTVCFWRSVVVSWPVAMALEGGLAMTLNKVLWYIQFNFSLMDELHYTSSLCVYIWCAHVEACFVIYSNSVVSKMHVLSFTLMVLQSCMCTSTGTQSSQGSQCIPLHWHSGSQGPHRHSH